MIDPLGPDPNDPAVPPKHVGEIVPHLAMPEPPQPTRPRVRYANYDSPEAIKLKPADPKPEQADIHNPTTSPDVAASPVANVPDKARTSSMPSPVVSSATPNNTVPNTALARAQQPANKPSKLEKAVGLARVVLPLAGKLLPLLEGNVAGAAANLLAGRPAQEVNLKPLEESIGRLQADQRAITFHTSEHKRQIQRLQDDFSVLKESLEKHAADQAEIVEHMAKLAKRMRSFMRFVTILLVLSIVFSLVLVIRIAYIIRF